MLVRRLEDAPVEEWHRLRTHVLMDAGERGSRHLSVTWLSLPAGAEQTLSSQQESEQAYVVVRGAGTMSVAGDTQQVREGDLILVPPATEPEWRAMAESFYPQIRGRTVPADMFDEVVRLVKEYRATHAGT